MLNVALYDILYNVQSSFKRYIVRSLNCGIAECTYLPTQPLEIYTILQRYVDRIRSCDSLLTSAYVNLGLFVCIINNVYLLQTMLYNPISNSVRFPKDKRIYRYFLHCYYKFTAS